MSHILASTSEVLFKQRVQPLSFSKVNQAPDTSLLSQHLSVTHSTLPVKTPSLTIGSQILQNQISRGFNSDKLQGRFFNFSPTETLKTLKGPATGAAWNQFESKVIGFVWVIPPYPIQNYSPDGRPFLFVSEGLGGLQIFSKPGFDINTSKKFIVSQPVAFNTGTVYNSTTLVNGGFIDKGSNIYEGLPREIQGLLSGFDISLSFNSPPYSKVYLNADMFLSTDPGLFTDQKFINIPAVNALKNHIDNYPHKGLDDGVVSENSGLTSSWISRYSGFIIRNSIYGGDTWFEPSGVNRSHPVEPLANGTLVYWIALYNGEEAGKKVVAPDGTLLARPVNGKKKIRCAFTLPAEQMPIADPGVLLRRLNPTWGFKPGLA